jgi:sugar fermentation stimulation protein A
VKYDFYLPRLIQGRLLRRHQRFKADIELSDGSVITAHCPNSGSMKGCLKQGAVVYVSESKNPNRKLRYTWQLIRLPSSLVLVNTTFTNNIVQKALVKGKIRELLGYKSIKKEYMYEPGTRIDFLLNGQRPCLLEVKSCTLVEDGIQNMPQSWPMRLKAG